jgi:hypothetical protein
MATRSILTQRPEFFPLPQRGPDPHFGLSRSTYYDLERRGLLRLVRVRKPGNLTGRVLVPFGVTLALIHKLASRGNDHPKKTGPVTAP